MPDLINGSDLPPYQQKVLLRIARHKVDFDFAKTEGDALAALESASDYMDGVMDACLLSDLGAGSRDFVHLIRKKRSEFNRSYHANWAQ